MDEAWRGIVWSRDLQCGERDRLARRLGEDLDQRHRRQIQSTKAFKTFPARNEWARRFSWECAICG